MSQRTWSDTWSDLESIWRLDEKPRHSRIVGPRRLDPDEIEALVRTCRRRRLLFWLALVVEAVVVAGWLVYSWNRLAQGSAQAALATGVIVLTLAGWGISLSNRRGQWRSLLGTPLDCARSEVTRARAARRSVILGWSLVLAVDGFLFVWMWAFHDAATVIEALPIFAVVTSVYAVTLALLGWRARRLLRTSEAVVHQLSEEE